MRRGGRGGGEVVEREVAVGHGVDRVRRRRREAELAATQLAVGGEVDAGERAGAERQTEQASVTAAKRPRSRRNIQT